MTRVMMEKGIGGLKPASEEAQRVLGNIAGGTKLIVDVKDPRRRSNVQNAFWFAILDCVWENSEAMQKYAGTMDAMRALLLIKLGYCDTFAVKSGETVQLPKSVAFGSMEQADFTALVDSTLTFCCEDLGFNKEDLVAEARRRSDFKDELEDVL